MGFDSNRAWQEASASVSANRELLLALAGVFFLLPLFLFGTLAPQIEPQPGATPQMIAAQLNAFVAHMAPYLLGMSALQLIGTLTIMTLLTDKQRPTVAHTIKLGAIGALPCFGAQLLWTTSAMLILLLASALGLLAGIPSVAALLQGAAVVLAVWLWVRFSLAQVVVAAERTYNPIALLRRSWRLTQGNAGRLWLFWFLLILGFLVVGTIALWVIGMVAAVTLPAEPARIAGALAKATFVAGFLLYFIATQVAAHRQLAGLASDTVAGSFE